MRTPLQKFTNFINQLLPHETKYLLSIQQFDDPERLQILKLVDYNAQHIEQFTPYDISIDKRKYNHLKNWISSRLNAIDVDHQFNWFLEIEQKIRTDTIRPIEEKLLLKAIREYQHPSFSFTKFYELVRQYRHFLLIRLRYEDHRLADEFVKHYKASYLQAKEIFEKLHDATIDIVGQYSGKCSDSKQWEGWLTEVFFNEQLEGHLRYLAMVRMVFIAHNYKRYDTLRSKFDYLDLQFQAGKYYSKRLLLNYYNNRLMLHSNFKEYDQAVYFGYLSIRAKTHDYILYINNLCAVLLRLKRNQEALELMQGTLNEAKNTKNFHNRVGFIAFYMKALNKNGLSKRAENYGDSFLMAFSKEVIKFRWHLFFTVYLETLLHRNACKKLIKTIKKYRLKERDKAYQSKSHYVPVIPIFQLVADCREGNISIECLSDQILNYLDQFQFKPEKIQTLHAHLEVAQKVVPEIRGLLRGSMATSISEG